MASWGSWSSTTDAAMVSGISAGSSGMGSSGGVESVVEAILGDLQVLQKSRRDVVITTTDECVE